MQLKKFNGVFSNNGEGRYDRCIVSVHGKTLINDLSDEEVENLLKEDGNCASFRVKMHNHVLLTSNRGMPCY